MKPVCSGLPRCPVCGAELHSTVCYGVYRCPSCGGYWLVYREEATGCPETLVNMTALREALSRECPGDADDVEAALFTAPRTIEPSGGL